MNDLKGKQTVSTSQKRERSPEFPSGAQNPIKQKKRVLSKPQTPNPKPQTQNPKPKTQNPKLYKTLQKEQTSRTRRMARDPLTDPGDLLRDALSALSAQKSSTYGKGIELLATPKRTENRDIVVVDQFFKDSVFLAHFFQLYIQLHCCWV